jgi:hypothetical protein
MGLLWLGIGLGSVITSMIIGFFLSEYKKSENE